MPTREQITADYIHSMWTRLEPAFEVEWNRMELVEAWRSLDKTRLEGEVWAGIPSDDWGKILVLSNMVASVNASAIALGTAAEADVTVRMRNSISPIAQQDANYNRRAVVNMQKAVNQYRTKTFEHEVREMIYARGAAIVKHGFLTREQRGEVTEPITEDQALEAVDQNRVMELEDGQKHFIIDDGEFPGYLEVFDPLECVYVLGPGKKGLKLFIRYYEAEAYDVIATYPDVVESGVLAATEPFDVHGSSSSVRIMEYWDDTYHAITINDTLYYGPEEHNIGRVPIDVERVNEQTMRTWSQRYANNLVGRQTSPVVRAVTPFTWPMIDDVTKLSFAQSLLASKLPEMANTPIIHRGIATGDRGGPSSPYFKRVKTTDNRVSRLPRYRFIGDKSAGGRPVWPLFDGEDMFPLNPTPIADHLAIFIQYLSAALELTGMNAELLSGRVRSEPSGVSVNQQIQLTSSRMVPYDLAWTRLVSKGYTGLFRTLDDNWDRGNAPLVLASLTDEPDVELTQETVRNIVEVIYSVKNIFPRDREAELQAAFQAHAQGAMPLRDLIMKIEPQADPQDWMKQRAWEMMVFQDPTFLRSMAAERHKELGYGDMGPSPEAQQAAQQQQLLAGAASLGGQPPAPQSNGNAPPDVPPQIAALFANAGPPQGGGQ